MVALLGCAVLAVACIEVPERLTVNDGGGPVVPESETSPPCPNNFPIAFGGSCYRLQSNAESWFQAESECDELFDAHLVVIDSREEHDFLLERGYAGWIGLSDTANEGTWRWVTDAPLGFERWDTDEPTTGILYEDCAAIAADNPDKWSDEPCLRDLQWMCELDGAAESSNSWCVTGTPSHCNQCGNDCSGGCGCNPMTQMCYYICP